MSQAAAVGLIMTLAELVRSGEFKGLSAFLVAESGIATVVGTPPSFTVVGVVSRLVSAIAAAAPAPLGDSNMLLMTKKFEMLLNQGLEKVRRIPEVGVSSTESSIATAPQAVPPLPSPFLRGSPTTWRLRGAGYANVTHLVVAK
jgi:hypothetical protein